MIDQAIRFGAVLNQPEFYTGGNLLEVGSGAVGITSLIDDRVICADIEFEQISNAAQQRMKASATELPWKDGCFTRVVSSDMLEHIPLDDRQRAITEMVRVTGRTLFLACPCGDAARRVDHLIADLYRMFRVPVPIWLQEHLDRGIPDIEFIRTAIQATGKSYREASGESVVTHFFVSLLIALRSMNQVWKSLLSGRPGGARELAKMSSFPEFLPYRKLWVIDCR
ncbi:MAG: class I SAM-dependent methyltransferase [bacterium]